MRSVVAALISLAALLGMVLLLMRDSTRLWQLAAVGALAGVLVGTVRSGRHGAIVGVAVGCLLGLAAPFLYAPFWLVFTLPPHPECDL
ncbi:MAG: hypothetical protein K8U57_34415 [Planctomycetes bacterium]|nr:hypothetical protein [Planctomycetota bacterium]